MVALFFSGLQLTAFSQSSALASFFVFAPTPMGLFIAAYHAIYKMQACYCLLMAQLASLLFSIAIAIAYSGRSDLAILIDPGNYFLCLELWLILIAVHSITILIVFGIACMLARVVDVDTKIINQSGKKT